MPSFSQSDIDAFGARAEAMVNALGTISAEPEAIRFLRALVRLTLSHGDVPMTVRAMKSGAVEFLTKPFRPQELLDAVQQALDRDRKLREKRRETAEVRNRYETLTAREREVMELVVSGLLNKQIAAELGTGEHTVKIHRGHVMEKMKADSLPALIRMADTLKSS